MKTLHTPIRKVDLRCGDFHEIHTEFHPDRAINAESRDRNLFAPDSKVFLENTVVTTQWQRVKLCCRPTKCEPDRYRNVDAIARSSYLLCQVDYDGY